MESIIKTKNLVKEYDGLNRVDRLYIDIKKGEIYGFLGPNGAGKTTTMKMLLGLVQPTDGEIEILGKKLGRDTRSDILLKTGSIIENPSYYGHLTGRENMEIVEKMLDLSSKESEKVLKLVGLEEAADKKVKNYSLGMKQRLAIAMALVRKPEILILDEPTNGLDPAGTREIRELIKRLAKDYGITVMVSSHLLTEIEKIADRVGIIKDGKLIFQGSIPELNKKRRSTTLIKTSDNQRASMLLRNFQVQRDRDQLIIEDLSQKERARINRYLIDNGLEVYILSEKHKSLEELFLDLTEYSSEGEEG